MNRNTVYTVLKKVLGTYSVVVNKRNYKKLYPPHDWEYTFLKTDKVIIQGFHEIYICSDEIVIRDKYNLMQINIRYVDMEYLEVGGGNDEDTFLSTSKIQ